MSLAILVPAVPSSSTRRTHCDTARSNWSKVSCLANATNLGLFVDQTISHSWVGVDAGDSTDLALADAATVERVTYPIEFPQRSYHRGAASSLGVGQVGFVSDHHLRGRVTIGRIQATIIDNCLHSQNRRGHLAFRLLDFAYQQTCITI